MNRVRLQINRSRRKGLSRYLEIGPGEEVLTDFERYNIYWDTKGDYIGEANNLSLFSEYEFDLIYASHVLEHVPWYQTLDTLKEWYRVLKHGGHLEVWVPDGLKIAKAYVAASTRGDQDFMRDGWYRYNESRSPDLWFAGRMFSYGDGSGSRESANWHRAVFSEAFLVSLLSEAGFRDIEVLQSCDVRGHDHGWINLGLRSRK